MSCAMLPIIAYFFMKSSHATVGKMPLKVIDAWGHFY